MTFDMATIENDPFLVELALEVSDLEKQRDDLFKAHAADPDNIKKRVAYDASVIVWAATANKYRDTIKAVIGL
jgi:hypothetical protein